ncbi:hypothetical protein QA612_13870 [Evansella sp. AB-P1]|uniref:hypothetical protein n=1 Tax=Evansella sp. AB-P1 TaxID=3037653 RepID=UPI00241E481C|nr:hypothetical protein [Evansella sp. AB-P1]MDG5788569.1 hypothetical protein [Evansella sp. AB-P1]
MNRSIRKELILVYKVLLIIILGFFIFWIITSLSTSSSFRFSTEDVFEISVTEFEEFGIVNENIIKSFHEKEYIAVIIDAINSSTRLKGDVDMGFGDYNLTLHFKENEKRVFHLWISDDSVAGNIMDIEETETLYRLTKKSTAYLKELILH